MSFLDPLLGAIGYGAEVTHLGAIGYGAEVRVALP
jgi:predicted thioesterase